MQVDRNLGKSMKIRVLNRRLDELARGLLLNHMRAETEAGNWLLKR
jgi:hypothetical protein